MPNSTGSWHHGDTNVSTKSARYVARSHPYAFDVLLLGGELGQTGSIGFCGLVCLIATLTNSRMEIYMHIFIHLGACR